MAQLRIQALSAGYGGRPVLRHASAGPMTEGAVTALLGPDGSGKSTLLKTLAGLHPVMDGALWLDGEDLAQASAEALDTFERQVERLKASGYRVLRVPLLEDIGSIAQAHFRLMAAEMAQSHHDWFARHELLYREQTTNLIQQGQTVEPAEAERARSGQMAQRQRLQATMDSRQIDLWATPSATGPAPESLESTGNSAMSLPWTYTGMPALSIPAGFAANGLPMGLQIVGRYGADEQLLVWAAEIERALAGSA